MNKEKDDLPQKAEKRSQNPASQVDAPSKKPDSIAKKPRRKKIDGSGPAELENTLIGQQVHGILDGSFDAGYLLSVRVGDSTTTLRGLVFEPGLSIPLSKVNDIAPKVNNTTRDQHAALPNSIRPNPVFDLVAGSSPAPRLVTTVLPTHIQTSAVATQSLPLIENQAPLAVEKGQIDSALEGPVATKKDQEGPELADLATTITEEVSVPGGPLVTDAQGSLPTPIPESQEQKDISADGESQPQLQSN